MKKSSFVAMVLGTVSGVLFALGMCMALLPEWNAFKPGIGLGCTGLVLGLITWVIWRKMEHKPPVQLSAKHMLSIMVAIVGVLALGIGMCFCMVWEKMIAGIVVGLVGIVVLLFLIPLIKGIRE